MVKSQPSLKPGTFGRAETWPMWEVDGEAAPHPIFILQSYPNGNLLVLPISHSIDDMYSGVPLDHNRYSGLNVPGTPVPSPNSWLYLQYVGGIDAGVFAEVRDDRLVLSSHCHIAVTNRLRLPKDQYKLLMENIASASASR